MNLSKRKILKTLMFYQWKAMNRNLNLTKTNKLIIKEILKDKIVLHLLAKYLLMMKKSLFLVFYKILF